MKVKNILIGAALATGLYFAVSYFSGGIRYTFKGLKWLGRDGLKLKLALLYDLENVNDISATVTKITGKILYGDYELNKLNIAQPVTVAPGEKSPLEVQFTISPGTLLAELLRFFENKGGVYKFRLKGVMTGKIGEVPFAYPLNEILQFAE